MYSKRPLLLKSQHYQYTAEFRRTRRDKGLLRGKRLFRKRKSGIGTTITQGLLAGGLPIGGEILVGSGATVLLGRLRKGNKDIGTVAIKPEDKLKVGLQYVKEGVSLGDSPSQATIGSRLNLINKRVQRGINTYQDISRLPTKRSVKLKAGLGITAQVGQDVWRDLNKPITLRSRKS